MIHTNRRFQVATFPTPEALAAELHRVSTWTLCSAFATGDITLFNDSFSENGAQEYAVFRGDEQIESLTVSWMTSENLTEILRTLAAGGGIHFATGRPSTEHPTSPERCMFCA
jgi:hypothetical protein